MKQSMAVRYLVCFLFAGCVAAVGCKKSEEAATVPVGTSSETATPAPAATPTASDSASGSGAASGAPAAAPQQPAASASATAKKGESIDGCCAALKAVQKSGKTAAAK